MTATIFLALDPGKNTGWATFDGEGKLIATGVIQIEQLPVMLLHGWQVSTVIAEKFRVFPGAERKMLMNSLPAAEALGMIKLAAEFHKWHLVLQEPQGMRQWAAQLGYKYSPKTHIPDHVSAHAHGYHYLNKLGILAVIDAQADRHHYEAQHKGTKAH